MPRRSATAIYSVCLVALGGVAATTSAGQPQGSGGPPGPGAEVVRLRQENQRLKAEVQRLKHTRMLVPNPHSGEGRVVIADRHYRLEYAKSAGYSQSPCYRPTGDPNLAYYFRKGQGCLAFDPQRGGRPRKVPSQWPLEALSPDGSLAITLSGKGPGYGENKFPQLVERNKGRVLALFESLAACSHWVFAPGGRHAYPLRGAATGGVPYVDVAKRKVGLIRLTGDSKLYWHFSGVRLAGRKTLLVFANNTTHDALVTKATHRRRVVRIGMDKPDDAAVTEDRVGVSRAYAVKDDKVLCYAFDRRVALLSADTLKVVASSAPMDNVVVTWAGHAPKGNDVYVLTARSGLQVRDGDTLGLLASLNVGAPGSACAVGVTFSDDGKYACVGIPYELCFVVIDTQQRELVAKVALKTSAAGVLLWPWEHKEGVPEKRGSCLVITARLAYE